MVAARTLRVPACPRPCVPTPRALSCGGVRQCTGWGQGWDTASASHPIRFPGQVAVPDDGNTLDNSQPGDRGDRVCSRQLRGPGTAGQDHNVTCAAGAQSRSLQSAQVARSGQRRGGAVVAYNQRCLRCSQEDFSGRTKRSRAARAVERHSLGPVPEDMAISESISVVLHQLCWRSWEG